MDNKIYKALLKKNDSNIDPNTLLNSLLLLSINDVYICDSELSNYVFNIKFNSDNIGNEEKHQLMRGLNSKQFESVYYYILSIDDNIEDDDKQEIIINRTNDNINITLNKLRLDCSVLLIIENNINLKNKSLHDQQQKLQDKLQKLKENENLKKHQKEKQKAGTTTQQQQQQQLEIKKYKKQDNKDRNAITTTTTTKNETPIKTDEEGELMKEEKKSHSTPRPHLRYNSPPHGFIFSPHFVRYPMASPLFPPNHPLHYHPHDYNTQYHHHPHYIDDRFDDFFYNDAR